MTDRVTVYRRADGRWAWQRKSENGQVVSTDAGQGYEAKATALKMAVDVNPGVDVEIQDDA